MRARVLRAGLCLTAAVVLAGPVLGSAGPGKAMAIRSRAQRTDELVVRVYSYGGITWGRVEVSYKRQGELIRVGSCAKRRCYLYPRHGARLFLRETPRGNRWKFRAWIVRNGGRTLHVHAPTLTLRVLGHLHNNVQWYRARVKANYILP